MAYAKHIFRHVRREAINVVKITLERQKHDILKTNL